MYWLICVLLIVIAIAILNPGMRERFCAPCGEDLTNNENFCSSGCVEGFGNYCPDRCSSKRYPLEYLYCQTCGNNAPMATNKCRPYYIPLNY